MTYVDLAKRLKKHGFSETEASITNKLRRGTFFRDVLSGLPCGVGIVGGDLKRKWRDVPKAAQVSES